MGSLGREDAHQGGSGHTRLGRQRLVVPYLRADKSGGITGEQGRARNPGFQHRKRKRQNFW